MEAPVKKAIIGAASAVLIFWLTQGVYSWLTKPKDPGPKTLTSFFFEGRVVDSNTRQLLSGAGVSMSIPGVRVSPDTTDAEGRFLFTLEEAAKPVAALLTVRARGYQAYSEHIPSNAAGAFDPVPDISLKPVPVNTQPADLPVVRLTKPATDVVYMRRPVTTAIRIPAATLKR
jgi:hypothetical protein